MPELLQANTSSGAEYYTCDVQCSPELTVFSEGSLASCAECAGLGLRAQGLGFRVWGLGFRVWGLGLGFRAPSKASGAVRSPGSSARAASVALPLALRLRCTSGFRV